MMSSLVIVFRETLEMALVIGVLMAATRALPGSRRWIFGGVLAGAVGAFLFALFMEEIESSFAGDGEFLFNAVILMLASLLIAWTVLWMSRHARELTQRMQQLGVSVSARELPLYSLGIVSAAAVMREGGEAVFFLFGAAQSMAEDGRAMLAGGIIGGLAAWLLGIGLYLGLVRIPLQRLFSVVGWLLMLLAAGMASQAAWNLVAIDWLPPLIDPLWDTSRWLSVDSLIGELLHVLIGYDDAPSAMQMLVFIASLATMAALYLAAASRPGQESAASR